MISINKSHVDFTDIDGNYHRRNGFSFRNKNGLAGYRIHGKYHREDGPAAIYDSFVVYYINGEKCTKEQYYEKMGDI